MAAIVAVMKMRCVRLTPAGGGRAETVDLEERPSNVVGASNLHVMPSDGGERMCEMQNVIIDNAAAQGAFLKDRDYRVEFTLLKNDGTDVP